MNLIFAIYTSSTYKEIHLPVLDDADYELFFRAGELLPSEDLTLYLESTEGEWLFKACPDYSIQFMNKSFEGEPIRPGQLIHVKDGSADVAAIFVWSAVSHLEAFRKYRVNTSLVTIGLTAKNDICYTNQNVISRDHAEIRYEGDRAYIKDKSKNGTYLNNQKIRAETQLHFGDLINLYGLSILYLGNILAISWLGDEVVVNGGHLKELSSAPANELFDELEAPQTGETMVHISPRNIPKLYSETETIENVPSKREEDRRPAWMSILPPLTMTLPMMVGFSLMNRGSMSYGIVISAGSAIVGVMWAIINYRFALKERRYQEKRRLERYEKYLVQCTDRIREKFEYNRSALLSMYPDAETCSGYTTDSVEIWARKQRHPDFLFVRLGLGEMPFQVKINAPDHGFTLLDDELAERPRKIAQSYAVMQDVPLVADLKKYNVYGILTGNDRRRGAELARVMIAQLAANYCYTDVKIAALYRGDQDTAPLWEYVRWLPHVWNEDHSLRYVADNGVGINDVLYSLTQILRNRMEQIGDYSRRNMTFSPHYLLFVADPAILENQMISKYLYDYGTQLGVTTIILADTYEDLPSACDFIIESTSDFTGTYGVRSEDEERRTIRFDQLSLEKADQMARHMSSMRVNQMESGGDIPNSLTFFEMMGIHTLDELDVLNRWRKSRTYETMRALIGWKMGGQPCLLDINEKYHGPHGLVAGTTGSGKSETLQTYILSLAVNYSPLDVGFFIIDFKGGGMANLFSGLPHVVGQISNLSGNQVRRAMVSIKSENFRRQRIFGEYGVNHIDAYTKLVKAKEATQAIPHLLIIIDEFAELRKEMPEFMRELISVAQVGRSLGVHLILATQRPNGVVDENIWSNTKFRICLRVADKQDSNDMLHKTDAAFLTQVGRGYLQVGNDELYEQFQSGWSGAVYDDSSQSSVSSSMYLDLQGREPASADRSKSKRKHRQTLEWIKCVVGAVLACAETEEHSNGLSRMNQDDRTALAKRTIELLNAREVQYPENASNLQRMEEIIQFWPVDISGAEEIAEYLVESFQVMGRRLPERQEKTQLDVVVQHLAETAKKHNFANDQKLWMPLLPDHLELSQLRGYTEGAFQDGAWREHRNHFSLSAYVGQVDDPENQMQYPLCIDLAEKGHLVVVGGVTSGKSTFLQTLVYSMITTYSPAELNVYAVDFSSQMLCVFEGDAHVGGVIIEGQDDKLDKLFIMLGNLLQQRKALIKGGSFNQYIQVHKGELPAVVVVIDGYANFQEKTEGQFEGQLLELSRSAEGYGIYLVISCAGFGSGELQSKIANNMRQSICLELGDKYRYGEVFRIMRFDVLPEENVKGRGLALLEGRVLEYQTALACKTVNDYKRAEIIEQQCTAMTVAWKGQRAAPVPVIPDKPVWEQFQALEQYKSLVRTGQALPVAYYQKTASLYSVDLANTFCYLVLGGNRTGKSVFLRNLMCAARDAGGNINLIDMGKAEHRSAELTGAVHITQSDQLAELIREMILLTNERGARRKEFRRQGLDDEEIFQHISAEYPPVYYFIADLKVFLDIVYTNLEGIGKLNQWVENIFAKGQLLNVYFFALSGLSQLPEMTDKPAYMHFIKAKSGVLMGGELNKQNIFSYQNIRYNDQGKRLKAGMGYAASQDGDQTVDLIVVPNNKGVSLI